MLREHISVEMVTHIVENIRPNSTGQTDATLWMGNFKGEFTVKSA